jgi:hypothetical protein
MNEGQETLAERFVILLIFCGAKCFARRWVLAKGAVFTDPSGRVVGLSDLWMSMTASWHLGRWESPNFAKNIEFVLLPVHRPTLFKHLELLCVGDAESHERQEHCTNADMRMCAFTNMPTMRTFKDRDRMCRSDRIRWSLASRPSRSSIVASNVIPRRHSERSVSIISGNHTLCPSPAAIWESLYCQFRFRPDNRCG